MDPAEALASLLLTAGGPAQHIPPDLEARAGRWQDHVAGRKILLVLDDAAGQEQVPGDYPAAAASSAAALELFRDLGDRHGLSKALNSLGELSLRTSAGDQAARQFGEALALTRQLGTPHEEARALEGIGRSLLGRDPAEAGRRLREALAI